MNYKIIFLLIFSIFLTACPSSEPTNKNTGNTNAGNSANNAPVSNANSELTTTRTPEAATTNNAPTLAPVVSAYFDALKKKDDAALKNVLSAEFVKTLEADAKAEGKKSLTEYILSLEEIPAKPVEVRNEKIEGDKATAELKGGVNLNWTQYVFRKENGVWKMTNEFADLDKVNKPVNSNTTTNTAK